MNERIRQLALQACVHVLTTKGMEDIVDGCYVVSPDKLAKFAELIVQDCIGIAHEVGRNPFIEACQERSKIIKNIEKHFGVEE